MTVKHISENPYLQYFIGEKEYTSKCPFSAVSMTRFRKRISVEDIQEIIEMTIPKKKNTSEKKDDKTNTKNTDDNPQMVQMATQGVAIYRTKATPVKKIKECFCWMQPAAQLT